MVSLSQLMCGLQAEEAACPSPRHRVSPVELLVLQLHGWQGQGINLPTNSSSPPFISCQVVSYSTTHRHQGQQKEAWWDTAVGG